MSRSTKMLIVLAVLVSILAVAPSSATTWNAAADYHAAWTAGVFTNGPWSYGYISTASLDLSGGYTFGLMSGRDNGWESQERMNGIPGADPYGMLVYNPSDTDNPNGILAHGLAMHPASNALKTVVRFTASATGSYAVSSTFTLHWVGQIPPWGGSALSGKTDSHVVKYVSSTSVQELAGSILQGTGNTLTYSGVVALNAGESMDFIVGEGGDTYNADMTRLAVVISTAGPTGTITGTVTGPSGPASGVTVKANDTFVATTGSDGVYSMTVPVGTYSLQAQGAGVTGSASGVVVTDGATTTQNISVFSITSLSFWYGWPNNGGSGWTYGYSADSAAIDADLTGYSYTLYDSVKVPWNFAVRGTSAVAGWEWYLYGTNNQPVAICQYTGGYIGGVMLAQDESAAYASTDKHSIYRWTALVAGDYTVSGEVRNRWTMPQRYQISANASQVLGGGWTSTTGSDQIPAVTKFAYTVNLAGGSTVDFIARANSPANAIGPVIWDATIKSGKWAITGYVEDPSHNRIAGATVSRVGGTESVTTDSAGNYTIVILTPGTYSLAASKTGYNPATVSGVSVDGLTPAVANIQLTLPGPLTGTVKGKVSGTPVLADAQVATTDGVYTTTTDSAGNWSLSLPAGDYTLTFYKYGYAAKIVSVTKGGPAQSLGETLLDQGWDFAADFTNAAGNPRGPWTYGYYNGTAAYTPSALASMTHTDGAPVSIYYPNIVWWDVEFPARGMGFCKYDSFTPAYQSSLGGVEAYTEGKKVVAESGNVANQHTIARFTAPTGGYFNISARFAASSIGSANKVALMYNGSYLLGGPSDPKDLDGFVGTAANNYTDSTGTNPVYTYSVTADLGEGDIIDAIVYNTDYSRGWVQTDLTVTKAPGGTLTGQVTAANMPGNPVLPGATVIASGPGTYSTTTDTNGNYSMNVQPGIYTVSATASGYNNPSVPGISVVADGTATQSFSLTHGGEWNLKADYSNLTNPNGQWSYGYVQTPGGGAGWAGAAFVPHTYGVTESTLNGWRTDVGGTYGWIAKNTTASPVTYQNLYSPIYFAGAYIEPGDITFGGGDGWVYTPAVSWKAPTQRLVKVDVTIKNQTPNGNPLQPTLYMTLAKNRYPMITKSVSGFVGRASSGYTDSVGPNPVVNYQTQIALNADDTLEFEFSRPDPNNPGGFLPSSYWPHHSMSLQAIISPGDGTVCSSIADIKSAAVGGTVVMATPVQLASATVESNSFNRTFTGSTEYAFYVQNDDRTQGIKCVSDGAIPNYGLGNKITFTGTVAQDAFGKKYVQISSINGATAATAPAPLGKGSKALTNTGTLIRVWGKITSKTVNPDAWSDLWDADPTEGVNMQPKYDYEYITINDGGNDVKILMHVQANYMTNVDGTIGGLAVGDYVGVTGIAMTTNGTDVVVAPRSVADIVEYIP